MHEWIKAARLSAQLTQTELADAMGVTKGNVSAWENARHEASHDQLLRIAQITGVSVPMPGIEEGQILPSMARWPFQAIDPDKVSRLSREDIDRLEGAIIYAAGLLNFDLKK